MEAVSRRKEGQQLASDFHMLTLRLEEQGKLTFDILDFSSTKASKRSLVLGTSDTCRAYSSLNIYNGSSHGRSSLPSGQAALLSSHLCSLFSLTGSELERRYKFIRFFF